ncbi:MAG TPA: glutaminase A [Bacillales bacterium]|nr:glutaminase A [Bacillales bacterium]
MMEQRELLSLVEAARPSAKEGKVADYIPALAQADQSDLAAAVFTKEGEFVSAGDEDRPFTLQSVVKVLTLALAVMDRGAAYVFDRVGMEPTGDPFNAIGKLEDRETAKPLNPMINAGALVVTGLVHGKTVEERLGRMLAFIHDLADNSGITYNEEVARSEFKTSFLNRSLCYFMKQYEEIEGDVEETIDFYTKVCAIEVSCRDLARIGAVIANNGEDPLTGRKIIPDKIVHIVKTFMVTCGMYNASGEFAMKVGIPAKSGVSGAVLGAIPQGGGIGIYGPALDKKGNSVAGVKLMELLSARYGLSIFY